MSENNQNKPIVDMIRVNEFRQQSLLINELQRRLRVVESRLPDFEQLTRDTVASITSSPSSHTHTMGQISDNLHSNLPGLTNLDHEQYNYSNVGKTGWGKDAKDDVTITFTDGTRTFSIDASGSDFTFWVEGVQYTKTTAQTVVITDTEGNWYIYFDNTGTLIASQTPWVIADNDKALVATVYWDATNNENIMLAFEMHTFIMNAASHDIWHHTVGTQFEDGLAVSDNADGSIDVSAGEIHDEDNEIAITDSAGSSYWEQDLSPAQIPIYYRLGASGDWKKVYNVTSNTYFAYQAAGPTEPYWNEFTGGAWTLNPAGNNAYIVYWIIATPDMDEPIISVMGQGSESVLENSAITNNDISSFSWGDFPSAEFKVIAQITVRNTGAPYTTTTITDYRQVSILPSGGYVASDHGSLSGLLDNDHTQYLLIANIDDTPVNAEILAPISSNWAFDHAASPANVNHLTDAEVAALHPAIGAGDLNHNDLANLNAGDVYEHISAAQLAALHAKYNATDLASDIGFAVANLVDKASSETIAGEWTFGIFPITPSVAPDANYEVANKKYVDDTAGGGGIGSLVEDLTPQLGGDLDLNTKNIDFPTTANISDCLDEDNMVSNSATKLCTQQSIKAYADAALMIGSGNITPVPMIFIGSSNYANAATLADGVIKNADSTNYHWFYNLKLPTNRGGLKLYIDDFTIVISDADGSNYVTTVYWHGVNSSGKTTISNSGTNLDSVGDKTIPTAVLDCSGYDEMGVQLATVVGTASYLDIASVMANCYYA